MRFVFCFLMLFVCGFPIVAQPSAQQDLDSLDLSDIHIQSRLINEISGHSRYTLQRWLRVQMRSSSLKNGSFDVWKQDSQARGIVQIVSKTLFHLLREKDPDTCKSVIDLVFDTYSQDFHYGKPMKLVILSELFAYSADRFEESRNPTFQESYRKIAVASFQEFISLMPALDLQAWELLESKFPPVVLKKMGIVWPKLELKANVGGFGKLVFRGDDSLQITARSLEEAVTLFKNNSVYEDARKNLNHLQSDYQKTLKIRIRFFDSLFQANEANLDLSSVTELCRMTNIFFSPIFDDRLSGPYRDIVPFQILKDFEREESMKALLEIYTKMLSSIVEKISGREERLAALNYLEGYVKAVSVVATAHFSKDGEIFNSAANLSTELGLKIGDATYALQVQRVTDSLFQFRQAKTATARWDIYKSQVARNLEADPLVFINEIEKMLQDQSLIEAPGTIVDDTCDARCRSNRVAGWMTILDIFSDALSKVRDQQYSSRLRDLKTQFVNGCLVYMNAEGAEFTGADLGVFVRGASKKLGVNLRSLTSSPEFEAAYLKIHGMHAMPDQFRATVLAGVRAQFGSGVTDSVCTVAIESMIEGAHARRSAK